MDKIIAFLKKKLETPWILAIYLTFFNYSNNIWKDLPIIHVYFIKAARRRISNNVSEVGVQSLLFKLRSSVSMN